MSNVASSPLAIDNVCWPALPSDTCNHRRGHPGLPGADLVSGRYSDSEYEYRHVSLPKAMLKAIPKDYHDTSKGTLKLLWEDEWRALGITQVRCTNPLPSPATATLAWPMPLAQRWVLTKHRRVWAGSTTRSTSLSRTFCSSSWSNLLSHHGSRNCSQGDRRPLDYQPPQ